MLLTLMLYLALGAAAGVVAGLFGIGGGLLIVPVLIFTFTAQGMSADVLTHAAIATSLATIVVTSMSSIRTHHSRGAIRWELFKPLTVGILLGAFIGVQFAAGLAGATLQIILGCFVLVVAARMVFSQAVASGLQQERSAPMAVAGVVIGSLSSLFGIGGGTLTVPFLSWCRVSMQQAVATSAACGLPIALVGALSNVYVGWGNVAVEEHSLGFVYLPAFIGIVITSAYFAKIGANLAHKLPAVVLKRCFAIFLLVVGVRLLVSNLVGN